MKEAVAPTTNLGRDDMAKAIPKGYHALTPSIVVDNAADAIEFYKRAFGAKERMRMPAPGGTIGHAELEIGFSPHALRSVPAGDREAAQADRRHERGHLHVRR